LRSAFTGHGAGLFSSLESRVPLSYLPALHAWQMVVPLLFVLAAAFGLSWRAARQQSTRDILRAFGVAIGTSLLVNDSAAYEITAGIAVVGAFARFAPAPAPARASALAPFVARVLSRAKLEPEPVPVRGESPPG
jgi:purine-cytosine permease-like protein